MTELQARPLFPIAARKPTRLERIRGSYLYRTAVRYLSQPRWLGMYLLSRFALPRRIAILFARRAESCITGPSVFPDLDPAIFAETVKRDGYCGGLHLPQNVLNQILRFAQTRPCHPDRDASTSFFYRDHCAASAGRSEPILIGRYVDSAKNCPAIEQLQNDPFLREVAAQYLGARPVHIGNRVWWSFVRDATEVERVRAGQGFHYDTDDWKTVTFFFYLTDAGEHDGPHVLVRGSHRRKRFRWLLNLKKSRDEAALRRYYGDDPFVTLCGKAGYGFAEDLFCYHRGSPPTQRDRLMLQIRFGLRDYGNARDTTPG